MFIKIIDSAEKKSIRQRIREKFFSRLEQQPLRKFDKFIVDRSNVGRFKNLFKRWQKDFSEDQLRNLYGNVFPVFSCIEKKDEEFTSADGITLALTSREGDKEQMEGFVLLLKKQSLLKSMASTLRRKFGLIRNIIKKLNVNLTEIELELIMKSPENIINKRNDVSVDLMAEAFQKALEITNKQGDEELLKIVAATEQGLNFFQNLGLKPRYCSDTEHVIIVKAKEGLDFLERKKMLSREINS